MTTSERILWNDGKNLWFEYVSVNGYSTSYDRKGILILSKLLDLNIDYITKRLNIYLNN